MASITQHEPAVPLRVAHKGRRWLKTLSGYSTILLPKGLYARALIIIIAPIVLLQSVLVFVIMERHWDYVTRRLTAATVQDISMLISMYEAYPEPATTVKLTDMARDELGLVVQFVPDGQLPPPGNRPFFRFLDRTLSKTIRDRIDRPFWIDTVGASSHVDIRIDLGGAIMKVLVRRSQTYASNTHIFLIWMISTSLVLLTVAVLFLRNQIKPILALAQAAECFGRGQPVPESFRVRGAREVRQASLAFMEMRDRIERHVVQRTTMLAGVSHDLRTVLTRFRLQLAMLGNSPEVAALVSDVDEMQHMLEDYLAFSKGGSGEEAVQADVFALLKEIHTAFKGTPGKHVVAERARSSVPRHHSPQCVQARGDEPGRQCHALRQRNFDHGGDVAAQSGDHGGGQWAGHRAATARGGVPAVLQPGQRPQSECEEHRTGPGDRAGHHPRPWRRDPSGREPGRRAQGDDPDAALTQRSVRRKRLSP